MTPERLAEIRARWEATGPDAWHVGRCADGMHGPLCPTRFSTAGQCHNLFTDSDRGVTNPCAGLDLADATFAAHAHQDIPDLLAEVERLRAAVGLIDLDDPETVFTLGTDAVTALRAARAS